jgi:hypothetical protein
MKNIKIKIMTLSALAALLLGLYACAGTSSIAKVHPMEIKTLAEAVCSNCHMDARVAFDHTADFLARHRFYAEQKKYICSVCHSESFCSDCHAGKAGLIPSDKYKDSPEIPYPHRGDYLVQHRIDGRINPALCMKCHGRRNNERCVTCHK